MQSNKKSKKEIKKGAKIKATPKNKVSEESVSSIRKVLSKFLTNLCEKNYSEANKNLEKAVEDKVKGKIKKSANNAKNIAAGKSNDAKNASYGKKGSYNEKNSKNVTDKR